MDQLTITLITHPHSLNVFSVTLQFICHNIEHTHIPPRHTIFQVERHVWRYALARDIATVIQTDVARKHIAGVCWKKLFVAFNVDVISDMMDTGWDV